MYHDIVPAGAEDSSGFPGRDAALYKITPEAFEAQLGAIRSRLETGLRNHPNPPAPPDPLAPQGPPAASALTDPLRVPDSPALLAPVITFDDGGASAMAAADALERHRFTGHFFITVNYLGTPGFVAETDLRQLRQRGHVIGSHSCSHPIRMGRCSWHQLREEWTRSRAALSDILGEDVACASVPGGEFAPAVAEAAAAAGFTRLFTSEPVRSSRSRYGLTLEGRFVIQRWTSPDRAAALATGAWLPCTMQYIEWNAKKIGKRLGGDRYLQLRRLIIRHGKEVRWGDERQG
jgi:peptidoglycan/xylan/chitin deacetylase (PgdA/CDA1 family)